MDIFTYLASKLVSYNACTVHSKKFGVHSTPNLVCQHRPNWHTIYGVLCTPFCGVHSTLNLVCYTHHFQCGQHTLYGVLYCTAFCPGARFHINMYINTQFNCNQLIKNTQTTQFYCLMYLSTLQQLFKVTVMWLLLKYTYKVSCYTNSQQVVLHTSLAMPCS